MQIELFEQQLANAGNDFQLLSPFQKGYLQARFIGSFEGEKIVWDAHLYTLTYYLREIKKQTAEPLQGRAFIDVGDLNEFGRRIEIGLHLPYIDEPCLIKTMVMVRQYKRLKYGRHEFGEQLAV